MTSVSSPAWASTDRSARSRNAPAFSTGITMEKRGDMIKGGRKEEEERKGKMNNE